jgi:hypothetical protein
LRERGLADSPISVLCLSVTLELFELITILHVNQITKGMGPIRPNADDVLFLLRASFQHLLIMLGPVRLAIEVVRFLFLESSDSSFSTTTLKLETALQMPSAPAELLPSSAGRRALG